jgi:hypothetical protein
MPGCDSALRVPDQLVRIAASTDTFAMWASSSDRLALGRRGPGRPVPGRAVPGGEELRASDADRDHAIGKLRDRFAEGRLSQETFLYRMDVALNAKFPSELSELFADLPLDVPSGRQPRSGFWRRLRPQRHPAGGRASRLSEWLPPGPLAAPAPAMAHDQVAPPAVAPPAGPVREPIPLRDSAAAIADPRPLFLPRQEDRRFSIGRAPSCDFTVADISVSRWHARLQKQDDNWLLSDLGSTNGTRLNGWRVTGAVPVRPGDQITFGNASFLVTDNPGQVNAVAALADPPKVDLAGRKAGPAGAVAADPPAPDPA